MSTSISEAFQFSAMRWISIAAPYAAVSLQSFATVCLFAKTRLD